MSFWYWLKISHLLFLLLLRRWRPTDSRPCLLCSLFDPSGKSPSHKDLLCDDTPSKPLLESKGSDESFDVFPKDLVSCAPIEPDLGDDKGHSFITTNLIGDDVQVHNGRLFTERSRSIFVLEKHIGSSHLIDSQERSFTRVEKDTEEKVVD